MTPKEKAQELIGKCYDTFINDEDEHYTGTACRLSKQCALIAVDEIMPIVNSYENALSASQQSDYLEYWYEVKQELEKI
jgi:hypothetical protein